MIRTVIIDDEPRSIKLIAGIIAEHCPSLELVGSTDNFAEAVPLIENLNPSLLLLDIEFPTGNVFHILEKLSFRNFHIIFITAHNSYATEAFRQNAVDYILKPVSTQAVINAINKVERKINERSSFDIDKLVNALKFQLNPTAKIVLPEADGLLFLDQKDIIHCEANGRYTTIYFDQKKLTFTKTLKEVEALLNPVEFFRIHNSHIINLRKVAKYHRADGGTVELVNGANIRVASSRKEEFLDIFMNRSK